MVAGAVAVVLTNALAMIGGLIATAAIVARHKLERTRRLAAGLIYFTVVWFGGFFTLAFSVKTVDQVAVIKFVATPGSSLLLLGLLVGVVPALWLPARYCARQLLDRGHGVSAGVIWVSALAAAALSVACGLAICVRAFGLA